MGHPLDPSFAKLKRAETHIADLKVALSAFLQTSPYRLIPKLDEKKNETVWTLVIDPIPLEFEAIAADAVHNLRTPLDKMLASDFRNSKIHTKKSNIQRLKMPGVGHVNELAQRFKDIEEHLTGPVIKFLKVTEPYPGGKGETIAVINELDNRDKHRSLLQAIKLNFSTFDLKELRVSNGRLLRMGSRRGQHLVPAPDARPGAWDMIQSDEALRPTLRIRPPASGACAEFASAHDDMEIFTTTPGAQAHANFKPTINVSFSESRIFEGEPALYALETMRQSVAAVLDAFKAEFF